MFLSLSFSESVMAESTEDYSSTTLLYGQDSEVIGRLENGKLYHVNTAGVKSMKVFYK